MALTDWRRETNTEAYLRDEAEPYALPVILLKDKNETQPTHEDALIATVYAVFAVFSSPRTIIYSDWFDNLNLWMQGRIRKVVRRAKTSEFEKVSSNAEVVKYGTATVAILPPHPLTAPPTVVKRLQVSGLELEHGEPSGAPQSDDAYKLLIAFNPDIEMSTGKSMAQIGHAAQLIIMNSSVEAANHMNSVSFPEVVFTSWDSETDWDVSVKDAGFTEVAAGSETVRAKLIK